MKTWNNEPLTLRIEIENGHYKGRGIVGLADGVWILNLRSSGYYEPSTTLGGPENMGHPEEWEDERTLESVTLRRYVQFEVLPEVTITSPLLLSYIFDMFEDEIYSVELLNIE